ncbi:MAG: 2-oxo acid dehydrogenase subunit E2 [bacterium]
MIKEVKLPEVSDNIENGDVIKVLVKVGDTIEMDQPVIELETDKAMFEVPSTEKGIVKEINVKAGDVINIGAVILKVETNGSESKDDADSKKENDKEGEDTEGKDEVKKDDPDKKNKISDKDSEDEDTTSDKSEDDPEIKIDKSKKKDSSETKDKGSDTDDESSKEEETDDNNQSSDTKEAIKEDRKNGKKVSTKDSNEDAKVKLKDNTNESELKQTAKESAPASPSVRRLARELGVEIAEVNGSADAGRITEEDVKKYVKEILSGSGELKVRADQKALPDFKKWGEVDIQPMSKIRAITADSLTYAWSTVPMVTQFDKADITSFEEFRKKNSDKVKEAGGHLTITSVLLKVCTAALKAFPQFNSSIDYGSKEIYFKKYYNVGVAVDTDRGLLVPVIKNSDKKNLTEISVELNDLAEKARNKKITPDDMDGGNFTISNLGGIGGTSFTPIVYSPQVAILGVSRGSKEAVLVNENFEPRLMLPLSLTYDHRIIDGADAARFLRWICEVLENPMRMFL